MMQALHIFAMQVPFKQGLLSISPISFQSWLSFFMLAATIIIVMEIFKKIRAARDKDIVT